MDTIRHDEKEAFPVNEVGSPWAILAPARFGAIKYSSRKCSWTKDRKWITADLKGVFFAPFINVNDKYVRLKADQKRGKKTLVQ